MTSLDADPKRIEEIEHEALAGLLHADRTDIVTGLLELWPIMRHISRETSWQQLSADVLEYPTLRDEICRFLDEQNTREARLEKAQALQPILDDLGDDTTFWAVLGPVYDAVSFEHTEGFGALISTARQSLLQARAERGQADLYDYWLLFRSTPESHEDREEVCLRFWDQATEPWANRCRNYRN